MAKRFTKLPKFDPAREELIKKLEVDKKTSPEIEDIDRARRELKARLEMEEARRKLTKKNVHDVTIGGIKSLEP